MKPKTLTTEVQEAVIHGAREVLEGDERVAACWLEGSFASGTADPWSDVDLHVAVDDGLWDSFFGQRLETLARIATVLGYGEVALPWGAHLIFATLAGPVRVDLYLERLSRLSAAVRLERPRVLFDRVGAAKSLKVTQDIEVLIRTRLQESVQQFFFGAMWPVRLWGRAEWGTLLMNATAIIYQFLVPAMLVQDDPAQFFRPHYHNERYLRPHRRRAIYALLGEAVAGFRGIEHGRLDYGAVVCLHEHLLTNIWRELRAACEMYGVAYPEEAEGEMREYYRRELGMETPD